MTDFARGLSSLDAGTLEALASELLRLLDGGGAARGTSASRQDGEDAAPFGGAERGAFEPPAGGLFPRREDFDVGGRAGGWNFPELLQQTPRELRASAEFQAARQQALAELDAAETARAAFGSPEDAPRPRRGLAADAEGQSLPAAPAGDAQPTPGGTESDMDAISEFFRRDSRRYDTGFGA
ncbi:MAG: hypothetical protein IJ705_06320 [Oscillospiraceae bacterium]|nr:hypothetical protein [Oscillospiraceae bacterium]